MRNTLLTILFLIIGLAISPAQTLIDNFDSSYVNGVYQINLEPPSTATISDNHSDYQEGTGSLNFNAVLMDLHAWGTYAEIQQVAPQGQYFDWSTSDTLRLWIKVYQAPTLPENMFFRFAVMDQPNEGDPSEMFVYENAAALDVQTDWYELVIPFVEIPSDGTINPSDTGFTVTPTGWGLPYNNMMLDKNKLVSYQITAVTDAQIIDSLKVGYDHLVRTGNVATPFVFFNGLAVQGPLEQFTWGQSALEVEEGTGATSGTNSLKWTQGDEWGNGWTGAGWNITDPYNMGGAWAVDSLKFKMKVPAGTDTLRFQFESGADGKVGYLVDPIADDQWHQYALPLRDFVPQDGTLNFDSTSVSVFQFMAEENAQAGRVIYLDDIWTGNPTIDVIAPPPPANISVVPGSYVNTITWDDVPSESGETYRIYYSTHQITDITDPDVEVVTSDVFMIGENVNLMDHLLIAPATDQEVSYYYAMTCTDDAGNTSIVSQNSGLITNTAKGVTPINPVAPVNFAADGDLSEWSGITPFRMFLSDGTGHKVTNTTIDDDADLSVLAYVAMDNDNIYLAFDVTDDVVSTDTTDPQTWLYDSPDFYIGLYNWHGAPHNSYKRGSEPDYHFRFARNAALIDNLGGTRVLEQGDPNYYWDEKFLPGYVVEAKIALADLATAGGDDLFTPVIGMRIPLDFSVNDNDSPGTNVREGIMTYSPYNEDHSWEHPYRWVNTWIGDQWTGVDGDANEVLTYNLEQNYPNPFNPTTLIQYSLQKSGIVTLKVYDMLGREIKTLVNENQNAGSHVIEFNAQNLASGVYLYRLETGSFTQVKKMIFMK